MHPDDDARLAYALAQEPATARWLAEPHHHLVTCASAHYPPLLRDLPRRPPALYVAGRLEALAEPQIAIVGSRNPSIQGLEIAHEFAVALGAGGLGIMSGLAEGIDTAAHRGALAADASTIAVLANGPDIVYPYSNQPLAAAIARQGALVTEFAPGTPPRRTRFPRRNRLMAALSIATLVVEAACRSGSLITARAAEARGRPVFAIPGSIRNPLSRGCHALIKCGARLAESTDDILRELNVPPRRASSGGACALAGQRSPEWTGMDKQHEILLDAVGFDAVDIDTLVVRTGFKAEAVSSLMLILELEGHVTAAPGGRYSRNRRAGGEG